MSRILLTTIALGLLALATWRMPAFQGAVSWSLPGHEDLTFWVHHNGLEQIDVDGEVGYGDLARALMRRRSNRDRMHALRDRFVFRDRDFAKLDTPDLLKDDARYILTENRIFNIPAVSNGKGYLHKAIEKNVGVYQRVVAGKKVTLDVRPLVPLRVKLLNEHGRPTSARVYLTASDGLGYAPKGSVSRFAAEPAEQFFHAAEGFELRLPAGETLVEAARGPEYKLAAQKVELQPGHPATITLKLERWVDMARQGWYSSDAHIHANYTAPHHQVITPQDVLNYTLGEDLHIPNMMVANSSGAFLHDTAFFEGKAHALSRPSHIIRWNEEMRNSGLYGHMCLYGLKKLVEPLYTGFRDTPFADDYPPNYAQAKATQDQGGAVTYAHPGYSATLDGMSMREAPVDAALGVIDAIDVLSNNPEEPGMELWYRLLNSGLRIGISAGTDAFTNVADHYIPGGGRVYAHVNGALNYDEWLRAYKHGRTFATNGPMVWLRVNGREPGDEVKLAGPGKVSIDVKMLSAVTGEKVELIVNGKALSPVPKSVTLDRSSWIAARVTGPWHRMVLNDAHAFAHTSPVYVTIGGKPVRSEEDRKYWTTWIDGLIQRVEQRGRFSTPERRREVVTLFRQARDYYGQP